MSLKKDRLNGARTPRTLHCHEHANKQQAEAPIGVDYPGCAMAGAKEVERDTPQQLQEFIAARERASEWWLDEVSRSVNNQHCVSSKLAFQTFAPTGKETLADIFSRYSGAPQ